MLQIVKIGEVSLAISQKKGVVLPANLDSQGLGI